MKRLRLSTSVRKGKVRLGTSHGSPRALKPRLPSPPRPADDDLPSAASEEVSAPAAPPARPRATAAPTLPVARRSPPARRTPPREELRREPRAESLAPPAPDLGRDDDDDLEHEHDDDARDGDVLATPEGRALSLSIRAILETAPGRPFSVKQVIAELRHGQRVASASTQHFDARFVKRTMRALGRAKVIVRAPGARWTMPVIRREPEAKRPAKTHAASAPPTHAPRDGRGGRTLEAPPEPRAVWEADTTRRSAKLPIGRARAFPEGTPARARDSRPGLAAPERPGRPVRDAGNRSGRGRATGEADAPRANPRADRPFCGLLRRAGRTLLLIPDVPDAPAEARGARSGTPFVVVDADEHAEHDGRIARAVASGTTSEGAPRARLLEVLGSPGTLDVEIRRAITRHEFEEAFPEDALAQAALAPEVPPPREIARRVDLRHLRTVAIDPATARDHDDAVAIELLPDGTRRLYVSIADVSWYVPEDSPLDVAARARATSVYFPDRVVPMLPERLSAHLCSLVEGVDRLALTVVLDYDASATLRATRVVESVVHCVSVLAYEQVWKLLSGEPDHGVPDVLHPDLRALHALARRLRSSRRAAGSLDFNLPEPSVTLDADGLPTSITRASRNPAHELIEDFMLAANRAVATELSRLGARTLFRVHAPPDPAKLEVFAAAARSFGFDARGGNLADDPLALARLTASFPQGAARQFLDGLLLRSMSRAVYSPKDDGHFGLAFDHYTHFTSPIRRYPDLVVHRQARRLLAAGQPVGAARKDDEEALAALAMHTSTRERAAGAAEQDVVSFLCARFMLDKLGAHFDAHVTGVTEFGVFVRLDAWFVEGLVHVRALGDDFFQLDARTHRLVGQRTGVAYRVGDAVTVEILSVDLARRFVDMRLVGEAERAELAADEARRKARAAGEPYVEDADGDSRGADERVRVAPRRPARGGRSGRR